MFPFVGQNVQTTSLVNGQFTKLAVRYSLLSMFESYVKCKTTLWLCLNVIWLLLYPGGCFKSDYLGDHVETVNFN
jgi:hypothetical protein